MALPKIRAVSALASLSTVIKCPTRATSEPTVNVALTFVGLRHEEIGHMSSNRIFVADGVPTEDFHQTAPAVSYADKPDRLRPSSLSESTNEFGHGMCQQSRPKLQDKYYLLA